MLCEKYKLALIESAVSGRELAPAIHMHVAGCSSCAAELAQQQSLAAAIDANLRRQMNAPVPASMLQRFEAHLAQQPQPTRTPRLAQIFAGAFATLAAALILVALSSHWKIETLEPNTKPNVLSVQTGGSGEIQVHIGPSAPTITVATTRPATHRRTRTQTVLTSSTNSRPEPEVIVPPDEQMALNRLIADLNHRTQLAVALAKPLREKLDQPVKRLEIPDLQMAALVIKPIAEDAEDTISRR
jgi:hypothetical protein